MRRRIFERNGKALEREAGENSCAASRPREAAQKEAQKRGNAEKLLKAVLARGSRKGQNIKHAHRSTICSILADHSLSLSFFFRRGKERGREREVDSVLLEETQSQGRSYLDEP